MFSPRQKLRALRATHLNMTARALCKRCGVTPPAGGRAYDRAGAMGLPKRSGRKSIKNGFGRVQQIGAVAVAARMRTAGAE